MQYGRLLYVRIIAWHAPRHIPQGMMFMQTAWSPKRARSLAGIQLYRASLRTHKACSSTERLSKAFLDIPLTIASIKISDGHTYTENARTLGTTAHSSRALSVIRRHAGAATTASTWQSLRYGTQARMVSSFGTAPHKCTTQFHLLWSRLYANAFIALSTARNI